MSVEQHAEAAANDIVSRLDGCGLDSVDTRRFAEIIQAAIDEATAPLRARIAELEWLGPLIEELVVSATKYGESVPKDKAEWAMKVGYVQNDIRRILKGGAP
jgi:hypothetical protein